VSRARYSGHIIGREGLKVDPNKVEVVKTWPTPQNVTDIRRFLGLANYFRKFIKGFSALAAPLTQLSSSKKFLDLGNRNRKTLFSL
jgi:hypothetical protein